MIIYILEKDEKISKELKELLELNNFKVEVFYSTKKFKESFLNNKPDLIITNPIIENFSPFHFVKWIRTELNDLKTPIIAYHNQPTKEILTLAKKYKVSSFILYPFNKKDLIQRIFKLLQLKNKIKIESTGKYDINLLKKNRILDEIKRKIDQLPPFPSVINEIERLINSKKSNASDFEEVIKKDQVITAKVLKIVNSPFFSLTRKISTISESVAYMGYDTLRSVVYSAFTSKLLNISLPSYGYKRNELWKHSYFTGCFSKEISKNLGYDSKKQEEIFIGGLLHDIGKLILGNLAKEQKISFNKLNGNNLGLIDLEKKYFFLNHQEVGKLIAEKWNLPEIHQEIIENHHLSSNNNCNNLKEIAITNLADFISKNFLKIEIHDFDKKKCNEALTILNLKEDEFEIINKKCENLMEKIDTGIF